MHQRRSELVNWKEGQKNKWQNYILVRHTKVREEVVSEQLSQEKKQSANFRPHKFNLFFPKSYWLSPKSLTFHAPKAALSLSSISLLALELTRPLSKVLSYSCQQL